MITKSKEKAKGIPWYKWAETIKGQIHQLQVISRRYHFLKIYFWSLVCSSCKSLFIRKVLVSQDGHDKGEMVISNNIFIFRAKVLSSERFWSQCEGEMIWFESMIIISHYWNWNSKICEKLFWVILIKRHVY